MMEEMSSTIYLHYGFKNIIDTYVSRLQGKSIFTAKLKLIFANKY